MKCSNCKSAALYEYRITKDHSVYYCSKDLPSFLYARRDAGQLGFTDQMQAEIDSALDIVGIKRSEEVAVPKKTRKKTAK